MLTGTAPGAMPTRSRGRSNLSANGTPKERQFIRCSLVDCDPLMRSLGRPNREQVVTTRPDQLTTLQALDLANGQILTTTLDRGAANILKANPNTTPDVLTDWVFLRALSRPPTAAERTRRPIADRRQADRREPRGFPLGCGDAAGVPAGAVIRGDPGANRPGASATGGCAKPLAILGLVSRCHGCKIGFGYAKRV